MNGHPRSLPTVARNTKFLHCKTRLTNFINIYIFLKINEMYFFFKMLY